MHSKKLLLYTGILLALIMPAIQGCYKDKGNYNYHPLTDSISITLAATTYTKVLSVDTLNIAPAIVYGGDSTDLSYQWQLFINSTTGYQTFATGKNLAFPVGINTTIPATGSYVIRLAVINKKKITDTLNPNVNQVYSPTITLTVVANLYRGLMVLHGDGTQCDVGLIQHNLFLPATTDTVTTKVTPGFYSYFNAGGKIPGIGREVLKLNTGYVYILTDKAGYRTTASTLQNTVLNYSALLADPSEALGNPQSLTKATQPGSLYSQVLVDNGQLFYGAMVGPLFNANFTYSVSPYVSMLYYSGTSRGVIAYDTISSSFIYSAYNAGVQNVAKFPATTVSSVAMDPSAMNANLVYMATRAALSNTVAFLQDKTTGEPYLGMFNFYTSDASKVTLARYSMAALPDIANAKYYAVGAGANLNYYATSTTLYQYLDESGNTASAAYSFPPGETISMMRMIQYEAGYKYINQMLIVATVDANGKGKIYAFLADLITGSLTLQATFDGTETGGARFGTIYDVAYKNS